MKLKNIDLITYCGYDYKKLCVYVDLTYLLYVWNWGSLNLKIKSYESFNNPMS